MQKAKKNMSNSFITPPITTYFAKSKTVLDFESKSDFLTRKSREIIEKTTTKVEQTAKVNDNEVKILLEENKLLQKNLKQAKIMLRKANDINMQKDIEIDILKKKLSDMGAEANCDSLLFEKYAHKFDDKEIKKIRSIKMGQRNDSTFILTILKALYKNQDEKIRERRATSRKFKDSSKHEISFEKKEIMRQMLEERIKSENNDTIFNDTRLKKLNEHMRHALCNAKKSQKKHETHYSTSTNTVGTNITSKNAEYVESQSQNSSTPLDHFSAPNYQQYGHFNDPAAYYTTQLQYSPIYPPQNYQPYDHSSNVIHFQQM